MLSKEFRGNLALADVGLDSMPSRRASSLSGGGGAKRSNSKQNDDQKSPAEQEQPATSTKVASPPMGSTSQSQATPPIPDLDKVGPALGETRNIATHQSLEDLLAEQLVAVERALAYNQVITQRLLLDRIERMEHETSPRAMTPRKRSVHFSSEHDSGLAQPLLSDYDAVPDYHSSGPLSDAGTTEFALQRHDSTRTHLSENLFPTFGGVKQLVVDCLSKPSYRVEDFYKPVGVWSWLAQHPVFNNMTLMVILGNTLWIAIDTDLNKADVLAEADPIFQVGDNFFCAYFASEMCIRFMAFKHKMDAFRDPWFVFDGFLVALMVWETWVMTFLYVVMNFKPDSSGAGAASVLRIFRIFRLTRVARTARLLSSVPELMILAKGMIVAMRSVMAILCLLALIVYIFSIVFTQLLAESETLDLDSKRKFATVPRSANFLLLQVLCGFDADFATTLLKESGLCYVLFLLYLLFGSLTIMNMLIGILCDVVGTVAEIEKEERFERDMEMKVESLAASLDRENKGVVCKMDFEKVIKEPDVILSLTELGVDVVGLMDFAFFVFGENEELSYTNFLHMVVQFRGAKQATVKDVMDMRKQISMQLSKIIEAYEKSRDDQRLLVERLTSLTLRADASLFDIQEEGHCTIDVDSAGMQGTTKSESEYCGTQ